MAATRPRRDALRLEPDDIASPEEIRRVRRTLAALGPQLNLIRLDPEDRRELAGQQGTDQLAISAACQRLARQQPELAAAAGAGESMWRELMDRDLHLEQVDAALAPLEGSARNGQLLLLARLTECNQAIARAAEAQARQGGRAAVLQAKFCGGARVRARQQAAARQRAARRRRADRQAEAQVAARERRSQILAAARRLREVEVPAPRSTGRPERNRGGT
ncbi:MAG: hypothetical protein RMK29_08455 [Myxococcales bacterium]|nr:hypothetical protein [Myxococcota bacterium]MDW8281726.1 hypothetical protein [Myxococcales bacterium]